MGPLRKPVINRARPTKIARRPLRGQLAFFLRPRGERLAVRRRRRRIIASAVALMFVAGSVWGVGFLSHNERFLVNAVSVSGTQALAASAVQSAFETKLQEGAEDFFSGINIFLYPRRSLESAMLEEFPRLASVSVHRESLLAQAVQVTVHERDARYRWCKGGHCYLMDAVGYIFADADGSGTAYEFKGGLIPTEEPIGQTFLRGQLDAVIGILKKLEEAGYTPTGITVENETDMQIPLADGYFLKVTFGAESADVAKNLTLITTADELRYRLHELEYVDLRFGNRVYYQLK